MNEITSIPVNQDNNNKVISIDPYLSNVDSTNKINRQHATTFNQKGLSKKVEPIKDRDIIEKAKEYFLNDSTDGRYNNLNLNRRNYCLFILGINVARRISDLLDLKIGDLFTKTGEFKEWIEIREKKTGKFADFQIHPCVQEAIKDYLKSIYSDHTATGYKSIRHYYLFRSRKGENNPISTNMAWKIMNDMANELELDINVGTHTLRKTWTYQTIKRNSDDPYIIGAVSRELNHSSVEMTYKYCGYDRELRSHLYMSESI